MLKSRIVQRLLFAALVVVAVAVSFYLGGLVGFVVGSGTHLGRAAPFEASWLTRVLIQIREGRAEDASRLLESQLDSSLITHGYSVLAGPPRFELPKSKELRGYKLLSQVAEYRSRHPSVIEDPEVAGIIDGIVGCLSQAELQAPNSQLEPYLRSCYREIWAR